MMQLSTHKQQLGLTLIEMMISMVISLILVLGVVSMYITSKRGFAATDSMGQQQENVRFSVDLLLHDLRMAGYSGYPKNPAFTPIAAASDPGNTTSDSITLQYLSATDCLGQATAGTAINKYYINNGNLVCLGNGGATEDVIADNIFNMQILYGLDTDNDCLADKYVRWDHVADPTQIVSVRVGLLSRTPTDSMSTDATNVYALLDQAITVTDKRIHRVYINTVALRNVSPAFTKKIDCAS